MPIGNPAAQEKEARAFRRCVVAGVSVLVLALGGQAVSGDSPAVEGACPLARASAGDRLAQLRPELVLLQQVGEVLGRAIVSGLRSD